MDELVASLAHATTSHDVTEAVTRAGVAPMAAAGFARLKGGWVKEIGGSTETIFDLASLTKSMTALAIARSGLDRRTPIGELVIEAKGSPIEAISLERVLAHRAGLEAHVALWERSGDPFVIAARSCGGDPERALYSDLGYILAGIALSRARGTVDAAAAIRDLVVVPLGLEATLGAARDLPGRTFAPTEGTTCGIVHDENAAALTGEGGSGHAGMFGTIDAVLSFATATHDAIMKREGALAAGDMSWLVEKRAGGDLLCGFDGKSLEGSSAGALAGPRTFGHLGFTGTSFWIDPDRRAVVSLLTNRVHPTRENGKIRAARPLAHDALWRLSAKNR